MCLAKLMWNKNTRRTRVLQNQNNNKKKLMDNFFFLFSLCFFAFESLFFSLVFSLFFRSSPNQVSKAKANHSGSLSNLYPYLFLGQNPKSNPMIFLPLFVGFNWDEFIRFVVYDWRWVSIEMSLLDLGLQFMIGMRWWGICWVWVCSL